MIKMAGNIKLVCPHCGNDGFVRKITDMVTITDNGECITDEFVKDIEVRYFCSNCGREVTNTELRKVVVAEG